MQLFEATLWDLDGMLVDTTEAWIRAIDTASRAHDVILSQKDLQSSCGKSQTSVLRQLGLGEQLVQSIRKRRDELIPVLLREYAVWIPGADTTLDTLRKRSIPRGIVTSSRSIDIDILDPILDIRSRVDFIIPHELAYPRNKPDPYPLELALQQLEKLGITKEQCIYSGDQDTDKDAALAAGVEFALFRGRHTPKSLTHTRELVSPGDVLSIV